MLLIQENESVSEPEKASSYMIECVMLVPVWLCVFQCICVSAFVCNQPHLRMTANMYKLCPLAFFFIHSSLYSSIHPSIHPSIHSFIHPFIRLFSHPFFLFTLFSYQGARDAVAKPKAKCNEPRRAKNYCSFVVGTYNNTYSWKLKYIVDRSLSRGFLNPFPPAPPPIFP